MKVLKRPEHHDAEDARSELGGALSRPALLVNDHSLPFRSLTPDEYEVLSFLLLLEERRGTKARVTYFGKTGDSGRDIIVADEPETELVQCKHYQNSVGVGLVRVELAKLYCNVFDGSIRKPSKVSFYLSSDLTAPAIDLLADQQEWIKAAPAALAEYLGEPPSQDLLAFARAWWPSFGHVPGVELTQRLRRYPALVEEFFAQRAVITGDVADVLSGHESIKEKLDLLLAYTANSPTQALSNLLTRAERENPGLSFSAEVTGSGDTLYRVAVKRGHGPVPVGNLRFGCAPNGAVGAAKFTKAMEEGRPVELKEGEFEWTPAYKMPGREGIKMTSLRIAPNLPPVKAPVRIEAIRGEETKAVIDLAYLVPKRIGTKEMELELRGGQLAARLAVVLRPGQDREQGSDPTLSLSFDLASLPAAQAVKTVRFLEALEAEGGRLRVSSLEFEAPLFVLDGMSALNVGPLEHTREFLIDLATISAELGVDVRFPHDRPTPDDARGTELLAAGIRHGSVRLRAPNDLFRVQANEQAACGVRDAINKKELSISFGPQESSFLICGKSVSAGAVTVHVKDPELVEASPQIPQEPAPDSTVTYDLAFRCSMIGWEFHRWSKPGDAAPKT